MDREQYCRPPSQHPAPRCWVMLDSSRDSMAAECGEGEGWEQAASGAVSVEGRGGGELGVQRDTSRLQWGAMELQGVVAVWGGD